MIFNRINWTDPKHPMLAKIYVIRALQQLERAIRKAYPLKPDVWRIA